MLGNCILDTRMCSGRGMTDCKGDMTARSTNDPHVLSGGCVHNWVDCPVWFYVPTYHRSPFRLRKLSDGIIVVRLPVLGLELAFHQSLNVMLQNEVSWLDASTCHALSLFASSFEERRMAGLYWGEWVHEHKFSAISGFDIGCFI